jgi:hypothetical protein
MNSSPGLAFPLAILIGASSPALADHTDCHSLPGTPVFHAADALAAPPMCHVSGLATTIIIASPTRIEWQNLTVGNATALYIISKPDTVAAGALGHASFHDVTGGGDLNIHGKISADGPLTLQNAGRGNIVIGNRADIYAPDITLTTLRAVDPTAYLATGTGRFDETPGNQASVIVNGDLLATSGSAQVLGAYVVVNQQGKLEAPSGKVRLFAGPNANVQPASVTSAQLVDAPNAVISHSGRIRAMEVELRAMPGYDSLFCPAGLCGGERGITIGGEITAQQVTLDTTHPLDSMVQNYTEGSLALVSPSTSPGLTLITSHVEPITVNGPIEDEGTTIEPPIWIPPLPGVKVLTPRNPANPSTSPVAPLSLTYGHLNAVPRRANMPETQTLADARGARGGKSKTTAQKAAAKAAKAVVSRGRFFGVPTAVVR